MVYLLGQLFNNKWFEAVLYTVVCKINVCI